MDKKINIVDRNIESSRFYDLPIRNRKGEFVIRIFKNIISFRLVVACLILFILLNVCSLLDNVYFSKMLFDNYPLLYVVINVICILLGLYPIYYVINYEGVRIYTKGEVKSLDYHYDGDAHFWQNVRKKANMLGFNYEKNEDGIPNEKFTVFSKSNLDDSSIFPEEKIAIYRSDMYHAEVPTSPQNKRRKLIIPFSNYQEHYALVNMFCGKREYNYSHTSLTNPMNTIVIVIVDELDTFLYNILFRYHRNYVLFCVIAKNNLGKIFIGTDLRVNQDEDYRNRIRDLMYLLDIKGYDDKCLYEYFGPNEVKHKGKRLYKRNR